MARNFELSASDQTKTRRCFLGQRHVATLVGFLTCYLQTSNRIVAGVAIVAMVKHRQLNETSTWNSSEISCPLPSTPPESVIKSSFQGEFDWSTQLQGVLLGLGSLSYLLAQIPAGRLADVLGSKPILVYSNAATGILTLISPFAARWHIYAFIAVQFIKGATQGCGFPALYKMTSNWIPRNERGTLSTLMVCGYSVGMAVTGIVTGWLCDIPGLGWPSAFYIWGAITFFVSVGFHFIYYETPSEHPWITAEELKFITDGLETKASKKQPPTPWKKIFTSMPCYAYFYGLAGHTYGFVHFFTVQPTFMGTVLHYSMAENGLASCLPILISTVSGVLSSMASHWITKKNLIRIDTLRKIATGSSALGFSLCMAGILLAGCDAIINILFFALSLFSLGIALAGIVISGVDMAPVFSGSIMGVAAFVSGISSTLVPVVAGLLTTHETLSEWRIVFWINLVVVGSSGLVYVLFGSAEVQPWNYPEGEDITKEIRHKDQNMKLMDNKSTEIEEQQ
ncbi:unnamed protein product [Larinioides sclopetarius]|uniref:Major facilitator superfamily (MFS) profile domain-containing protein n=1 Tax=Larinioides sclopetarius TaxID=280406 RepID=A0AAV2BAB2_9ARAC